MAGILKMEAAMKAFEKSGKVARLTDDGAYRLTITRQPERQAEGQYLLQVYRMPKKDAPKAERIEQEELALRFDSLQRVLSVTNQAMKGGLDIMLLFHRPASAQP